MRNNVHTAKIGWVVLITLIILPVVMSTAHQQFSDFTTNYSVLGELSRVTGILAVVCYCFNLILTTRLSFLETMFGGLNKLFIAHHLVGGLSLCFALLHTVTVALRSATISLHDAAWILIPGGYSTAVTFGVVGLWSFIGLMVVTFYIKLPYHIWLITHKLLGAVFLIIIAHVILISNDISASTQLKVYLVVLFILAIIAYIYRTMIPRFTMRRFDYKIDHVTNLGADVLKIEMSPIGKSIDFKPGQFLFISFLIDSFSHEWHPFSISSHNSSSSVSITVKSLGKYTGTLSKLGQGLVGSMVKLEGAYGRFNFKYFKKKRQIWIAGGIGITPFLSMVDDVTSDYQVDLIYSVKKESELIDIPHLSVATGNASGGLRVFPYVTDTYGFLTAEAIESISGNITKDTEILLCGPPTMMHALKAQLLKKGIKKSNIHSEEFSMS